MRKLSILYREVLKEFQGERDHYGICSAILHANLNSNERYRVELDLYESNPKHNENYKNFTKHRAWRGEAYWWDCSNIGREQRILFLEQRIREEEAKEKTWWERFVDRIWWV